VRASVHVSGREGGRGETGAVAEEAAEIRGIGEAEVGGHSPGIPPRTSQQAPGFQQAPLVDEFTHPLAGDVLGGAAEGADGAAEQLGVVRGLADPSEAHALREQYRHITPGYHMNKKHWITLESGEGVDKELVRELVTDSYRLVVAHLPKAQRPVDPHTYGTGTRVTDDAN
jgi:hypothetical protein